MARLTIGDVVRQTGVPASTLRYYERIGLLPRIERVNGQRRYDDAIFTQIAIVRMAQEAGFTIDETRTLVSDFSEDTPAAVRWRELAQRKLPEVQGLIRRLQTVHQVLEESLQCDCLTLDACARLGWETTRRAQAGP